jgi:predicted AAA+ superfamily ATPase
MRGVRPKRITITVDRETMWRRWEEWRATERRRREERARRLVEQVIEQGPIVGAENLSPEQQKRTRTAMGIIRILATLAGGEISIGQIVAALKNNDDDVIEAAVRTLEKGGLLRSLGEYYYEWTVKPPWDDP